MKYSGVKTTELIFPLGGIGTGCMSIAGDGRFVDWEIYNRPNKGSQNFYSHLAVKAEADGKVIDTRVLHGDLQGSRMGPRMKASYMGYGHGPNCYTMAGLPHFKNSEFVAEFPFGILNFSDENFPGEVKLVAFNPFIPLNEDDSSIPAAFFEVEFKNTTDKKITYTAALSCKNAFTEKAVNRYSKEGNITKIFMYQEKLSEDEIGYGDMCIGTDAENISFQESWYRAGWRDDFITFWRNFTTYGPLEPRHYDDYSERGGDHGTIAAHMDIEPGESKKVKFVLSWSTPNNYNYWLPYRETVDGVEKDVTWKNYYATVYKTSKESCDYALKNWDRLYKQSKVFSEALYSQTLPGKIIEAIVAGLCVLKSPTCWRLTDGSLYGWEGCQEIDGACEGSCTHVWNYAYAIPFLFPRLERSMRDIDYKYNWREDGKMEFRLALPLGRHGEPFHACVDGQMGGIFKSYRDWKICGDDAWLKKNWEHIKSALAYAWAPTNPDKWDTNKDGILEGRQHNTLDTELFCASSWLEGYYLAALKAASIMADYFGEKEQADEYRKLFANGKKYLEDNLFNGKYYYQKIDLGDQSLLEGFDDAKELWNEETNEIKYQIGEGSEIDQVGAQWHSDIIGLGEIFDPDRIKVALSSMYDNNFKKSMRNHYNPWRLFCLDDEAGAVICDYPKGARKPSIPLSYAEETMHGFEYMLAAQLITNGMIDKGLDIIAGVRDRYDGEKRNPFNEIECGNNYARNMCTFSFIPLFEGFEFDMVNKVIGFKPIVDGYFKGIWSLDPAWGDVVCDNGIVSVNILGGSIGLNEIHIPFENPSKVVVDEKELSKDMYTIEGNKVKFNSTITVNSSIVCER